MTSLQQNDNVSNGHCFLDEMNKQLLNDSANLEIIKNLNDWMNDNEYDTDALIDDVMSVDTKHSNIYNYLQQQPQEGSTNISIYDKMKTIISDNRTYEVVVIGISGATRSGKSTLTYFLKKLLGPNNCKTLHQDKYFDTMKIYSELNGNWDTPKALNHDAFYKNVAKEIKSYKEKISRKDINKHFYIILEGFMLFYDERINKYIDHFVWIEIPKKICYKRRMSTKPETPTYFRKYIWPNHQQYKGNIFGENGDSKIKDKLLIVDGTASVDSIIQRTLKQIGRDDIIPSTR